MSFSAPAPCQGARRLGWLASTALTSIVLPLCAVPAVAQQTASPDIEIREVKVNEPAPPRSEDPRTAAALEAPLVPAGHFDHAARVVLGHSTRASRIGMAAGMGNYSAALLGTILTLVVLVMLPPIETYFERLAGVDRRRRSSDQIPPLPPTR